MADPQPKPAPKPPETPAPDESLVKKAVPKSLKQIQEEKKKALKDLMGSNTKGPRVNVVDNNLKKIKIPASTEET